MRMSSGARALSGDGAAAIVDPRATVRIILPAYCLDPTFSPPSGPMEPTVLIYTRAAGYQTDVWDDIRECYGSGR